jgi:hypothetical protein
MRPYVASNGSWKGLRLPVITLMGVVLGVGGWIAQAKWLQDDPGADLSVASTHVTAVASRVDVDRPAVVPAQTSMSAGQGEFAPWPAAPRMAALPPLPAPAKAETTGSNPPVAAATNKAIAPPKPKEPSVLATMHAQIAQMRAALKLTPDQERYWPPVEALLRDMAKQQAKSRPAAAPAAKGKPVKMVVNDADMQRLTSVAFPLLMTLREDQRRDALRLAQAMGFESAGAF